MKILVVSNFYPPHFIGGYEIGCHAVAEALERRGHQIAVLTSRHGVGQPTDDGKVFRWLKTTDGAWTRLMLGALEPGNQAAFDWLFRRYRPDVVYLWNLGRLPISIAFRAEARSPATCYYVSDEWLSRWPEDGWVRALKTPPSGVLKQVGWRLMLWTSQIRGLTLPTGDLGLRHVQFCSEFMKQATLRAGQPVAQASVVHWGVDTDTFYPDPDPAHAEARRRRFLFVGQLVPHKGAHTAVRAMKLLRDRGVQDATLTIVGGTVPSAYEAGLREEVIASGLGEAVRFAGPQPRHTLPEIYRQHGVLIFPSCWDEPFAITPLEAMASGLLAVGTTRGGSVEIFEDGVNALTFPEEDAGVCASQIERVLADAALYRDLADRGRRTVVERFSLRHMVDQIEQQLAALAMRRPT